MNKQPSEFAQQVIDLYESQNPVSDDLDNTDEWVPKSFNASVKSICAKEGISQTAVKKCIRTAKDRIARRIYIVTEMDRLNNLFGGQVSEDDIDDMVAENLARLIKSGEFVTHFKEIML